MRKQKKPKRSSYRKKQMKLMRYVIAMLLLAVSFILMPFGSAMKEKSMFLFIAAGTLFWTGLIGTIITAWSINSARRKSRDFKQQYPNLKKLGLIHFFQNKPAVAADVVFFVSMLAFILVKAFGGSNIGQFITLAFAVFSFGMHCMLNGINYIYIHYRPRREKAS